MDRFRWGSRGTATVVAFALFDVAAGCTTILGFERPGDIVSCVRDSDCPGRFVCLSNTCTFACARAEDCHSAGYPPGTAACVANQCVPVEPLDAGANDAQRSEGDDAREDTRDDIEATPAVAESSTQGGQACTPACPTFSYCDDASCLDFQAHGYPGPGLQTQPIVSDELVGLKIFPDVCGYLTGIGFVTTGGLRGQRIRVGLYTDNSGVPDTLIAQTAPATVTEGTNELAVETMPIVGCATVAPHYWIAGVWDDGLLSLEASAGQILFQAEPGGDTVGVIASLDRTGDAQIDAGLPATFPTPARPLVGVTAMPHVYVIVARTN